MAAKKEYQAVLLRLRDTGNATLGILTLYRKGKEVLNLTCMEPSDLFNLENISCIPTGSYKVKKHDSPNFGQCLKIEGVRNRTNILIHAGNYYDDTKGCVVVGYGFAYVNKDDHIDVQLSIRALKDLLNICPDEYFGIDVVEHDKMQKMYTVG